MMIPVVHTSCGRVAMWYMGLRDETLARSQDVMYLDGSRPAFGDRGRPCQYCAGGMHPAGNMVRVFNKSFLKCVKFGK